MNDVNGGQINYQWKIRQRNGGWLEVNHPYIYIYIIYIYMRLSIAVVNYQTLTSKYKMCVATVI